MRGIGSFRHQFPGGIFYPGGKTRLVDEALQRLVIGVGPPVCAESLPDEDVVDLEREQNLHGKREIDQVYLSEIHETHDGNHDLSPQRDACREIQSHRHGNCRRQTERRRS